MPKPFVVTGTGRSGTMGMSVLLNRAGVRTSFEEFFCARQIDPALGQNYPSWLDSTETIGEVSSLAPPYLRHLPEEVVVLHQVRNPVATLASLVTESLAVGEKIRWFPNIKFNRRYLPETSIDDASLLFYMKYWLLWNEMIEPFADVRYRIEDVAGNPGLLDELLGTIDIPHSEATERALETYDTTFNTRMHASALTWRAIPDSQLKWRILQKAILYGYSEAELDAYCPYSYSQKELASLETAKHISIQKLERFYRTPGNVTDGLIDLYIAAKAWGKVGVEVGSCWGESSEIACNFLKHLYCVDPWGPGFEMNEPHFDERMAAVPNHTKIKNPSHEACNDFADEFFDIAYIDALHDYENVKRDILCWFPKVKLGGWIAGHDYDYVHEGHVGVIQAVDEVLGQPTLRFVDTSFLFLKTPELTEKVGQCQ